MLQGWIAPAIGSCKCSAVESNKGVDGYNAAKPFGGTLVSSNVFEGKDKEEKATKFRIHVSVEPSQRPLCILKHILVDSTASD